MNLGSLIHEDKFFPDRVIPQNYIPLAFFGATDLFRIEAIARPYIALLKYLHQSSYALYSIPDSPVKGERSIPKIYDAQIEPTQIREKFYSSGTNEIEPWNIYSRYASVSEGHKVLVYGEKGSDLALLAVTDDLSEITLRKSRLIFSGNDAILGNTEEMLANRGVREWIGAADFGRWSSAFRRSYSRLQ